MSDLILSLPHYHRHNYSDLRSADNKNDFTLYVSFTGFTFYIAVRYGFDKHLYLTGCLMHIIITRVYTFVPNRLYGVKNGTRHYLSRSPNSSTCR